MVPVSADGIIPAINTSSTVEAAKRRHERAGGSKDSKTESKE
jgi:hypothetical protein